MINVRRKPFISISPLRGKKISVFLIKGREKGFLIYSG